MADYYPLIAKAVSGLEKSTGEQRRALYDRARAALVAQLRGVSPALNESDITRERLALEEAIRKVEAEAARRSRNDPPPPPPPRAESPPRLEPRPEPPRPTRTAMPPVSAVEVRNPPVPKPTVALNAAAARTTAEPDQTDENRFDAGTTEAVGDESALAERQRWSPGGGPSLSDKGLKGFRDVVAETETLGGATSQAAKNVRAAFAPPTPISEFERAEPRIEADLSPPLPRRPSPRDAERVLGREAAPEPSYGREAREIRRPREAEPPRPSGRRPGPAAFDEPEDELAFEEDVGRFEPDVRLPVDYPTRAPSSSVRQEEVRPRTPVAPRAPVRERRPATTKAGRPSGRWRKTAALVIAALLVLAIAAVAIWKGPAVVASFRGAPNSSRASDVAAPGDNGARAKISDRIGSAPVGATSTDNGALVAQKVVLYEEDQADPAGKRYVGSAVWRTEMVSPGAGQPAEMAIRADIEIPEQKMGVRWSLRRNDDKALPASHTVEIMFTLPADFSHGGISNIPGVLMKQAESTRGVPLAGLAVKVTTNFFLIGLSSVEADMQRNIQLLKERSWFDIPIVYNDGKRAIIAIEKGTPGDRVFSDAFAAWDH